MNLKEMIARQQSLLDGAKAEGRELTAEERAEFDSLQRSIDAARAAKPAADPDMAKKAVEAERQRVSEITALCRDFSVDADSYIKDGSSLDQVRAAGRQLPRPGQSGYPEPAQSKQRSDQRSCGTYQL